MTVWRILALVFAASIFVEGKLNQHQKRETATTICDLTYNNSTKVQCFCAIDSRYPNIVRSAECHLAKKGIQPDDNIWDSFHRIKDATKLTFSNTRGITLNYVPTKVFHNTPRLLKLEIKFGNIEKLEAYAFANLTLVEDIILSDNQIKVLAVNAFAHHRDLIFIGLDSNEIVEINRNVFIDLPSLEKLFLTNNKITTIHDRAFVELTNLRELEIDRNSLFSLNSETFSGLNKLQNLDLSGNSLEVIGDNTFLPLLKLKSLNLQSNKIQVLDEKAFHGLVNLLSLNLAHNNLTSLENVKLFNGLPNLSNLNLKNNRLTELKTEVMQPIVNNLYGNSSNLDVEDNMFPCDCRLEWFMSLINKTHTEALKLSMENLKCDPSDSLREQWNILIEAEKATAPAFEEVQEQNVNYEYYDDVQLNGKLFYIDIRDVANCTNKSVTVPFNSITTQSTTILLDTKITTKAFISSQTTPKTAFSTTHFSTTTVPTTTVKIMLAEEATKKSINEIEARNKESFTTVRIATVSAKPLNNNFIDQDMASDEARPDKIKAYRSIQDEDAPDYKGNKAFANVMNIFLIAIMFSIRLYV